MDLLGGKKRTNLIRFWHFWQNSSNRFFGVGFWRSLTSCVWEFRLSRLSLTPALTKSGVRDIALPGFHSPGSPRTWKHGLIGLYWHANAKDGCGKVCSIMYSESLLKRSSGVLTKTILHSLLTHGCTCVIKSENLMISLKEGLGHQR